MQLSYMDLLSPSPINFPNIGSIKSPTLREIAEVRYENYNTYLNFLVVTPEDIIKVTEPDKLELYKNLTNEQKREISTFNVIINSPFNALLEETLNFFFVDKIVFDKKTQSYFSYKTEELYLQKEKPTGIIHALNYSDIADIILQRNGKTRNASDEDISKIKNKKALEIYLKLQKGNKQQLQQNRNEQKVSIPNMISSLAGIHNSLNMINIWDLTIFQLIDQFQRQQVKLMYDITSTGVSVWGNEKNKFDDSLWYKAFN